MGGLKQYSRAQVLILATRISISKVLSTPHALSGDLPEPLCPHKGTVWLHALFPPSISSLSHSCCK